MNDQLKGYVLQEELGIDLAEVAARKAFLEFTETDAALLKDLHVHLESNHGAFAAAFYEHLQRFPEIVQLLGDDEKLGRLKHAQSIYFGQLTGGEYGADYVENRLRVGMVHQRVGLTPKWYIGAYRKYLSELMPIIFHLLGGDMEKCFATFSALLKIIFLDMELALDTYSHVERRALVDAQYQAQHDALTGLPGRSLIYDRIGYAYTLSRRGAGAVVTMLVDLDRFKLINDSLGHVQGDELLKQVVVRLRSCLRESDTVGRISGNEFVLVLLSMKTAEDATVLAKKVLGLLAAPFQISGQQAASPFATLCVPCAEPVEASGASGQVASPFATSGASGQVYLTASIGIAVSTTDGENALELLRNGTTALHQAKEDGGNNFRFFQAEMNRRVEHDMLIETGLHRALEKSEFELYYQPKINLRTGEISGAEALLRWRHPERGLLSPSEFIPPLEENGLIVPVGAWVLRTACAQAKVWQNMGIKSCRVAVNLSAIQLHRQDIGGVVKQVLGETGLEAKFLELEITESAIMKDVDRAVRILHELKSLGVCLSMDDFGTGHSSLNYLQRFAIDVLKIDQSFVRDITSDSDVALITRTIIDLGHNLGLKVIAEGVETEAQLAFLLHNRCDEMQGYYYSKPLPVAEYTALLAGGRLLERPEMNSGRTLLLVDDEENILAALKRLLRRDGYQIFTATSARLGFEILAAHPIGVIISDQRMPEMCGTDFLSRVKEIYPDTIRIVLSGYTDLQSITNAINQGAIYKFLTKPWEDELLRENIQKAFELFELSGERDRLTAELMGSNRELEEIRHRLEERIDEKSMEALRNLNILQLSQDILEQLPLGVVGVGDDGLIAVANHIANRIFAHSGDGPLQGSFAAERLPGEMLVCLDGSCGTGQIECKLADGRQVEFWCHRMGGASQGHGMVLVFTAKE